MAMKLTKEIYNGFIIFLGIGLFFLLMTILGLADVIWLRLFNIVFIFYGANRTIKMKLAEGNKIFISNAASAIFTTAIGVLLSIIGLIVYSYMKGGDVYVQSLSKTFLFGGNPSIMTYSICLFFEGMASSVMVAMFLMLYWNKQHTAD